jgi:transposase
MPRKRDSSGRPSILTQELIDTIISNIKVGAYVETASAAAGIHKDTYYRWLREGARIRRATPGTAYDRPLSEEEELMAAFSDAVEKAQAEAQMRDIKIIAKAAELQWQAAAWKLERKHPEMWGRRDRHDVRVAGVVASATLTPDEEEDYHKAVAGFFGLMPEIDGAGTDDE